MRLYPDTLYYCHEYISLQRFGYTNSATQLIIQSKFHNSTVAAKAIAKDLAKHINHIYHDIITFAPKNDHTFNHAQMISSLALSMLLAHKPFYTFKDAVEHAEGSVILVIDDVFTFGKTASDITQVLRNADAKHVNFLVFAKAPDFI